MSNLLLCMGARALHPFQFERTGTRVFTIEELCALVVQNAFLLDKEDFSEEMIRWIAEECQLERLAKLLGDRIHSINSSAATIAEVLLSYVQYNSEEEIRETVAILKDNANRGSFEKESSRADYMLQGGRFQNATTEYERLISTLPEDNKELRAHAFHNLGVMYAKLFNFKDAAEMFKQEYAQYPSEEAYIDYLAVMRMQMNEKEYVDFIGADSQAYSFSLKLEKRMNDILLEYSQSDGKRLIDLLEDCHKSGNTVEYCRQVDQITEKIRSQYRQHTTETI